MAVNRSLKRLIALVLAAGAVVLIIQIGAQPAAADGNAQSARIAHDQGNLNAVPPILARESAPQLAALERWEAVGFFSDPPTSTHYSNADLNAYGTVDR